MQIIHGDGVPKKEIGLWIARTRFFLFHRNRSLTGETTRYLAF